MKIAIILFNMGGPDNIKSVRPFLFNLFSDPLIIRLPSIFRLPIAYLIAKFREKTAIKIYEQLGGKSPILKNTINQSVALEKALNELNNEEKKEYKVFVSMRYSHPRIKEVLKDIEKFSPDKIILLPLYPQYSTTTTKSSFKDFEDQIKNFQITDDVKKIYSYHKDEYFIKSHVEILNKEIDDILKIYPKEKIKILFSAHSLPKTIIESGDPYQNQVVESVENIMSTANKKDLDYVVCYQSKVGPKKWLEPFTDKEIIKAAQEQKYLVVVPISFVSDHSETLVELDITYKELAEKNGAIGYKRVETLSCNPLFIKCLKNIVISQL